MDALREPLLDDGDEGGSGAGSPAQHNDFVLLGQAASGGPAREFDVEEQEEFPFVGAVAPFLGGAPSGALRRTPVKLNMSRYKAKYLQRVWGIDPILRLGAPLHPHPLLAASRALLERSAAKRAVAVYKARSGGATGGRIVALAPNVGREHTLYPGVEFYDQCVWNQIPMVHPNDAGRLRTAEQIGLANVCGCLAGECRCVDQPVCYTGTHVLYYVSKEHLVRILAASEAKVGFFVVNRFDGVAGLRYPDFPDALDARVRAPPESRWSRAAGDRIIEEVHGNNTTYDHPAIDWVWRGGFNAGEFSVVAETLESLGETELISVRLLAGHVVVPPAPDNDLDFFAAYRPGPDPLLGEPVRAGPQLRQLGIHSYAVLGHAALLDLGPGVASVYIDRRAVEQVAKKLAFRTRDQALLRDAKYYAEKAVKDCKYPPHAVASATIWTAALAMTCYVQLETGVIMTMRSLWADAFRLHDLVVGFSRVTVWQWSTIFGASLLFLATSIIACFALPGREKVVAACAILVWLAGACVFFARLAARNRHVSQTAQTWVAHAQRGAPASVAGPTRLEERVLFGHRVLPPPVANEDLPLDASYQVDERRERRHPAQQVPRALAEGLVVPDQVPVPIDPTLEAEVAGLVTRVLAPSPDMTPAAFEAVCEFMGADPWFGPARAARYETRPDEWDRWLAGRNQAEVARMGRARDALKAEGFDVRDHNKQAFVKLEKTLGTVDRDGVHPKKPRIIQALSDKMKAFVGPPVWAACQVVKKAFDGASGLLFASGRNADTIGEFFREHYLQYGDDAVFFRNDYRRYDSHLQAAFREVLAAQLRWMGVPPPIVRVMKNDRPVGTTPHGVRYEAPGGLCSGGPETSDFGSFYNGLCTGTLLKWLGFGPEDRKMVVLGDDGGGVLRIPRCIDLEALSQEYNRRIVDFGLQSDALFTRDISKFKFASHIVVPMADGHWRLSPMPGRVVAKVGWRLIGNREANLAGDISSLWVDGAHVPILHTILRHYKRLTAGQRPRGRPDWKIHAPSPGSYGDESWSFIHDRYGLTREDDAELDAYLSTVHEIPSVVQHRVLERLVEIDVA